MQKAGLFKLNGRDLFKGLVITLISAVVVSLYSIISNVINAETLFNMVSVKIVLTSAISAGLSYLIKNFNTNNEGEMLTPDK